MPGIAGIVDFSEVPSIHDTIKRMISSLNYGSPAVKEVCVAKNAAFATLRLEASCFHDMIAENEDTGLAFLGYLWDKEELKKGMGLDFEAWENASIAQLLLDFHKKEGLTGFYKLNGRFIIAVWEKKEKRLNLISDRYGFCKLFYWASPNRILFASEYKAIIWHWDFQKKVDKESLADFMALGYTLRDKTFFENIKLLPHGSVLTFQPDGKLLIERYWDYSFKNGDSPLKEVDKYVDEYYNILKKVVKKQVKGKKVIGLPLSGGLDSRALAGILDKISFEGKVKAFSYGNPDCFDVAYGRSIAKNLHYMHTYIPIGSDYLRHHAESFVWLTEGTVNCLNAHMMVAHDFINKNGCNTIMTGFLGDTVGGQAIGSTRFLMEVLDENSFFDRVFSNQTEILTEEDNAFYFKEHIYNEINGKTFNRFKCRYLKAPSSNRYFKCMYTDLIEKERRYVSFNIYAYDGVANVLAPFADNEFVDFALQVPDVLAFTRFVQREMTVKHLPKVASVPWNTTKLPLNASRIRKGLQWRWEGLIRNPLIRATIGRRYAKMNDNYLNTHEAIKTGSREFVEKHIRNNEFLAEYFNMDRVHQMLDGHMSGKSNEYGKITALLTISLWYKLFIEGEGFKSVFKDN